MAPPSLPKQEKGRGFRVSNRFDTLLKNAGIFSRGMQAAARTRFRSHTCGLSRVFSDVHAAGKHD